MSEMTGQHRCPGPECVRQVPNTMFCCTRHWFELPIAVRNGIQKTVNLSLLTVQRRAAIQLAFDFWREQEEKRQQFLETKLKEMGNQ